MNNYRHLTAQVRLFREEKDLVEAMAAQQGRTVSNLLHGLLRAEAFRMGLEWPPEPLRFGRPKEEKPEENS